jgi:tetratricopeptide (TPR) repeat protein
MPSNKTKKPVKKPDAKRAATKNTKLASATNGRPAKSAPPAGPPAPAKAQYDAFERAIQLFHKRSFLEARDLFEKARQGPNLGIAANAATHVRICERRLAAPTPEPKSAEEHYDIAIALINVRNLAEARRHLEIALQAEPRGDHLHYAMGVCQALSGDAAGAYDSVLLNYNRATGWSHARTPTSRGSAISPGSPNYSIRNK